LLMMIGQIADCDKSVDSLKIKIRSSRPHFNISTCLFVKEINL
jgi:hypothetical protein